MTRGRDLPKGAERAGGAGLFGCGIFALAHLPPHELPFGWLLAFTLPAALLGLLQSKVRQPWQRGLLGAALQVGALGLLVHSGAPLSRPAALACTILPPLGFVIARRANADSALGLFLSFCVLLVGVILDGPSVLLVSGYGVCACLALRSEAHLAACGESRARRSPSTQSPIGAPLLLWGVLLGLPCLFGAFAIDRALTLVPSPSLEPRVAVDHAAPTATGRRTVGLDDSFLIDGDGSVLSDPDGEPLLLVRTKNGSAVPRDLYLRSGLFAIPGLDRWQVGTLTLDTRRGVTDHVLRTPQQDAEVQWLEVDRREGARHLVFVPPATCELRGLPDLESDAAAEWLRQSERAEQTDYAVGYQQLPPPGLDLAADPAGMRPDLLTLPKDLDRAPFDALLQQWDATGSPMRIAGRIAEGLARHCRYDRAEPSGPHRHALQNFLFAATDRHGYCMHFASAAALLLRLQGVPCRIGVGLYGGDQHQQEPGTRSYGARHAHAWVEIPFAGRGYVVFDPTPAAERSEVPAAEPVAPLDSPAIAAAATWGADRFDEVTALVSEPWLLGTVLALVIVASVWPVGAVRQRVRRSSPIAKGAHRLLTRILQALAEAGHPRPPGQTLELFAQQLAVRQQLAPAVREAFTAYQEVRFGGRVFDRERERCMLLGVAAARGS